jgi:hypothetical protein
VQSLVELNIIEMHGTGVKAYFMLSVCYIYVRYFKENKQLLQSALFFAPTNMAISHRRTGDFMNRVLS